MGNESCMQAIYPIFAQAEFWRNAKKDRQTRGSTMLSIGVVQPALSLSKKSYVIPIPCTGVVYKPVRKAEPSGKRKPWR